MHLGYDKNALKTLAAIASRKKSRLPLLGHLYTWPHQGAQVAFRFHLAWSRRLKTLTSDLQVTLTISIRLAAHTHTSSNRTKCLHAFQNVRPGELNSPLFAAKFFHTHTHTHARNACSHIYVFGWYICKVLRISFGQTKM